MKKILFVALGATLLAVGCQKTEIINRVGDRIGFTSEMGKLTKSVGTATANGEGEDNLKAQDFNIWAYYVADDANTTADDTNKPYDAIEGIKVEYATPTDDATGWSTNVDYYWPGKGKELKFFAVSGIDKSKVTVNPTDNTVTVTGFVVDPDNANVDLMVADYVQQDQEDSKRVVMNFRHALSKIQFRFHTTSTSESVFVQSLKIKGLNTKGNVGATVTGTAFNDKFQKEVTLAFTDQSDTTTFTAEGESKPTDYPSSYTAIDGTTKTGDAIANDKAMKLTAKGTDGKAAIFSTWLMIPQPITGKKVEIVYLINDRQFKSIFDLDNATNLNGWAENQYVTYTVELSPNKISFDASVDEWTIYDADSTTEGNQDINMNN